MTGGEKKMGETKFFETTIRDVHGDRLVISTQLDEHYRTKLGALACVSMDGHDADGAEDEIIVALDQDALIATRSAIDMILIANEAKTALRSDVSRIGRRLYRFSASFARMGTLSGIFVAADDEIRNAIGRRLSFGDALGKHSDVRFDLEMSHLTVLSDDQAFIDRFIALGCSSGRNPLEYLEDAEEDV